MNERQIFIEALEKESPEERRAYLALACGDDAELLARIELLLRSHADGGSLLEHPVLGDSPTEGFFDDTDQVEADPPTQAEVDLGFLEPGTAPDQLGRLDHYAVLEVIGRGGMGVVLKAFDERLHRMVAVKVMAPQLATSATARKRFVREAQAAAAVRDEHVVDIHAVAEANGLPYLAMDYIAGVSLQERLDRGGPLEVKEILRIGMQAAAGLAAAHAQGLIHRDIKPANILLENGVERVRISDFGLARAVDDASLTQSGLIAGTPQYMAPEQARGEAVDHRADLFSLGSVLYAMCTGRAPFRAETTMAVLKRVCEDTPRPIRDVHPETPGWLIAIIDKLHAKDPAQRFQSAAEVAELLGQCLAHVQQPTLAPLPAKLVGNALGGVPLPGVPGVAPDAAGLRRNATERVPTRSRRRWALAAAVLLALFGGLGLTEATGVTQIMPTVIRIITGEGTLVIEVDDPSIEVTIAGDGGLIISGVGQQEVRLRPGSYQVQATKNGMAVLADRELVTITRGDKQVVRVRLESESPETNARDSLAPRAILEGHTSWVYSLAFSPDGKTLATGSNDQHVRLWDTATGDLTGLFHADDGVIYSLAYSPDGTVLVVASRSKVKVWDAATFELLAEARLDGAVRTVAFRPGDSMFATASDGGPVKLWKWDGAVLAAVRTLGDHSSRVAEMPYMSFNPQGTVIASATWDGMLYLWDVESGELLKSVRLGSQPLACVAFSPDGTTIAAGGYDKRVELRNADTLESVGTLRHQEWVWSLAFLHDGETLVSAGAHYDHETQRSDRPGELKLWDVAGSTERLSVDGYETGVFCLALSPDGQTLATGDFAGLGRLWDVDALLAAARAGETVSSGATPELRAFALLGGEGVAERRFDTLAEAVQRASDGDTIEVRGNGPFVTDPIKITGSGLNILAAEGCRPVIKLSDQGVQSYDPLLETKAALTLEGLEFQRLGQKAWKPGENPPCIIFAKGASLGVANCRFRSDGATYEQRHIVTNAAVSHIRNCLFLTPWGTSVSAWGQTLVLDNCLHLGGLTLATGARGAGNGGDFRLRRNTLVSPNAHGINLAYFPEANAPRPAEVPNPLRLEATENVFDVSHVLHFGPDTEQALDPKESESSLVRVLTWRGRDNVYQVPAHFVLWTWPRDEQAQSPHGPSNVEDWGKFWNSPEPGSVEGAVRYQGGDLLARLAAAPEKLTPDDFRLRPDSAGYRAGPDGKDLGADVDLVGPGPAYERWKQTPEYQQWLDDTGQAKVDVPQAELQAFVVLGGEGVADRKYDTLAEAAQGASDGDTIEVRGNGPFVGQPMSNHQALTIRAGEGYRPVIRFDAEGFDADAALFKPYASLVLEGLELRIVRPEAPSPLHYLLICVTTDAPLSIANCRLLADTSAICLWAAQPSAPVPLRIEIRNSEMFGASWMGPIVYEGFRAERLVLENCLLHGPRPLVTVLYHSEAAAASIRLTRNTFVSADDASVSFWAMRRLDLDKSRAVKPITLEASENVFDSPAGLFRFAQGEEFVANPLPLPEAKALLQQLLDWRERGNLYPVANSLLTWTTASPPPASELEVTTLGELKTLEEWNGFWGQTETKSLEGRPRFEGGNIRGKPFDQLTPEDFCLRPDSAGYRAGPDGKDLGADVDLVGPGPAYERWKLTPAYQEWRAHTGQVKVAVPQAELQAFVVLGGEGVAERKFDTLAEAVLGASDGDTIEVRGNGPFVSDGVNTRHPLVIRAGTGFTPSITLSQASAEKNIPLVTALDELVLEGLDLRRTGGAAARFEDRSPLLLFAGQGGSLHVANCRLIFKGDSPDWEEGTLFGSTGKSLSVRNSLLSWNIAFESGSWFHESGGRYNIDNCVCTIGGIVFALANPDVKDLAVRIRGSTLVGNCLNLTLFCKPNLPGAGEATPPIRLEFSGNVARWDASTRNNGFLFFHQALLQEPFSAVQAEALLPRLVALDEEQNVYRTGTPMLRLVADWQALEGTRGQNLADWDRLWGQQNTSSVEGDIRFQGGDLITRGRTAPELITAEDFRLRPDSAGYRAGPDGKDLGADVDLVGPGAAYERWKQTPEYQQWLQDTGQMKVEIEAELGE